MKTLVLVLFLLAGCASAPSSHYLGAQSLRRGDLPVAERQLRQAISEGESTAWNDLGVVYARQGRQSLAVDAFKMGARYGDPAAKTNLAARRLPIPPADLLKAEESDSAALGGLLNSFSDGYRGNSVTCDTIRTGDFSRTNCR